MNKFFNRIGIVVLFAMLFSCSEEEPLDGQEYDFNYLISSYTLPDNMRFITEDSVEWRVVFSSSRNTYNIDTDSARFLRTALEHGENGNKIFYLATPQTFELTVGVDSIKIYALEEDLSDSVLISWRGDIKYAIEVGYTYEGIDSLYSRYNESYNYLSEMTSENWFWLSSYAKFIFKDASIKDKYESLRFVVYRSDGTKIEKKISDATTKVTYPW